MSMYNRRNALIGWLTWITAKQVIKRKARQAAAVKSKTSHRLRNGVLATALAAAAGLFWFRRGKSSEDTAGFEDPTVGADVDEN